MTKDPVKRNKHKKNWREKNKEYTLAYARNYYKLHKDAYKRSRRNCWLKAKYGIDLKQWNEAFQQQNGICAICKKPKKLVTDHDHKTGKFRGLLCNKCNVSLGWYEQISPNSLTEYLSR